MNSQFKHKRDEEGGFDKRIGYIVGVAANRA